MATEEVNANMPDAVVSGIVDQVTSDIPGLISSLPPAILSRIETLILILQAVGVAFIIYVFYVLLSFVINWRRAMLVKRIDEKVDLILEKLDKKKGSRKKKK